MAYKNIVFIKLEKRLLNDHRWYMMNEKNQLVYIKLILLAAETYNKIPKNEIVLKQALRSDLEPDEIKDAVMEIKLNFPKLKENKHFMYFEEFDSKTNWRKAEQLPSNRSANAQQAADKEKEKEEDKEKDIDKRKVDKPPSPSLLLTKYFCTKYEQVIGHPYCVNWGKDVKLMTAVYNTYKKEEAVRELIDALFKLADSDDWVSDKISIGLLKTHANRLVLKLRKGEI